MRGDGSSDQKGDSFSGHQTWSPGATVLACPLGHKDPFFELLEPHFPASLALRCLLSSDVNRSGKDRPQEVLALSPFLAGCR